MTRRFWAGLMLVAVLLAGGSAYLLLDRMAEPPPQPVRLKSVPPPRPAAEIAKKPEPAPVAPAVAVSSAPAKVAEKPAEKPAEKKAAKPAASHAKRNILFRLVRPTAKQVDILGDFNGWKRVPLKKDARGWTVSVPLAPGRYEYAYVIDGKKTRDPNNKQSANNGRVSVLTVKPLAKP